MLDFERDTDAATLLRGVSDLRDAVEHDAQAICDEWRPPFSRSAFSSVAENLAAYIAMRRRDLRDLQIALMPLGLSSLGRCESRVMPTLDAVRATLARIAGSDVSAHAYPTSEQFFCGTGVLQENTRELFGPAPFSRNTRIMVTLGTEAATDADLVRELVDAGMDCARINSAHDTPELWLGMIHNVRAAATQAEKHCSILVDLAGPKMRIEYVKSRERLFVGDEIVLARSREVKAPRKVPIAVCSLPEIFSELKVGSRVVIDDGRIDAIVERADLDSAVLRVVHTSPDGEKLRAEKGLNFPGTDLHLAPLTRGDYAVLDSIANEVDLIGYSFVNEPQDVALLQDEIAKRRSGQPCGIMLKIETARAVHNLPALIVQSARNAPTAVMIARGDLAIDIGYRRLAEMQEEMLWMCEAASVPVVWATQVLDSFVKRGVRSRSEFTDAAMAERADCVMLNKGDFIVEALTQIDDLLGRMGEHQTKKTSRLRALHSW
jgi:pyruvate kinase